MQTPAQALVVVRDQFILKGLSDDALKLILPAYQEAFGRLQFLLANLPPETESIARELWLRTQLSTIQAQFGPVADRIYQILPEAQAKAFEEGLGNAQKYLEAGGIKPERAKTTTLTGVTTGGQSVSVTGNLPGFNVTKALEKGFISPSITRQQVVAAARETGFSVLSPGGSKVGLAELLPNWMAAQSKQVERHLRAGFLTGMTNEEIMREIGPLGPGRRGWAMTEAVVRTSTAEASQSAHDAFYEANADLLPGTKSGYRWWWDSSNDTRLCELCAPLDGVKFKERDKPPAPWPRHFSCVLGDAKVSAAGFVSAARAWYSGDIVTIRTRSGRNLSVTSQHPVMSVSGWVRAANVRVGMKLICQRAGVEAVVFNPNFDNGPATAADVFAAFRASSEVRSMSVPVSPVDFHGDGMQMKSNVEVVTANRPLVVERDCQQLANGAVVLGDAVIRLVPESALGDLGAMFVALSSAANGIMSLAGKSAALIGRRLSHSEEHSLSSAAYGDARLSEPSYECGAAAGDLLSQLLHGHSALVESDEVSEIEVNPSHGVWVYDFGAAGYAYAAEGILSHNCRCKILPWTATQELLEEEDGPADGSFLEATPVQYDRRGKKLPPPAGYTGENAYKRPMKIDGQQQWVRRRDLGPGQTTAGDMLQNANEHSKRMVLGKQTEKFNQLTGKGGKYEHDPQGAVRELLGKGLPPGSTPSRPTRGPKPVPPAPKATPKPKPAPQKAATPGLSERVLPAGPKTTLAFAEQGGTGKMFEDSWVQLEAFGGEVGDNARRMRAFMDKQEIVVNLAMKEELANDMSRFAGNQALLKSQQKVVDALTAEKTAGKASKNGSAVVFADRINEQLKSGKFSALEEVLKPSGAASGHTNRTAGVVNTYLKPTATSLNAKGTAELVANAEDSLKAMNAHNDLFRSGTYVWGEQRAAAPEPWSAGGEKGKGSDWLATTIHEVGHQVHYRGGGARTLGNSWRKLGGDTFVSGYSRTNEREQFAEAFLQFVLNPKGLKASHPRLYAWVDDALNEAMK